MRAALLSLDEEFLMDISPFHVLVSSLFYSILVYMQQILPLGNGTKGGFSSEFSTELNVTVGLGSDFPLEVYVAGDPTVGLSSASSFKIQSVFSTQIVGIWNELPFDFCSGKDSNGRFPSALSV